MTTPTAGDPFRTDEPFRVELTVAAPAESVWRALRDKQQIRRWHGWEFDGLDAEIDEIFFTDVVESEHERRIVVNGGDTFDVVDVGDTSIIRMTRAPRDPANDWDQWYDDINEGWITFLHQLRFALERHPGEARRTVYLDGTLGASADPITALGLQDVAAGPVGAPYAIELAGEQVSGDVLFSSAHQAGFTVAQWGDGIVIVGVVGSAPHHPDGGVMAVLTTYGLPDERLAELEDRWTTWWRSRYPAAESSDAAEAAHPAPEAQPVQ